MEIKKSKGLYILAAVIVVIIIACLCKYVLIPELTEPKGVSKRSELEMCGHLIGKVVSVPLECYEIDGPAHYFCTDVSKEELIALIKKQPQVTDVLDLGSFDDGTERYLISTENDGGVSYIELCSLKEPFDAEKGKFGYWADDCNAGLPTGADGEGCDIIFPKVLCDVPAERFAQGEDDGLDQKGECKIAWPADALNMTPIEFFRDFYDNSAMYSVVSYSADEITVSFDEETFEKNPVSFPAMEENGVADNWNRALYKGEFRLKFDAESSRVSIEVLS